MVERNNVAVIDIGKTNVKLVLVDMNTLSEIAILKRPNHVLKDGAYPHYDVDVLWLFVLSSLKTFQLEHGVDAITATTHGGSGVLLAKGVQLATPIMDYEFEGVGEAAEEYDKLRPSFHETGSPRLSGGLNFGTQIHWLFSRFPGVAERTQTIVTYPQYWTARLTGVLSTEVTSLACHTDLWSPSKGRVSSMVTEQGWARFLAPLKKADEKLGSLLPEISQETGIDENTPVYCGIHDSNASLYPHILTQDAPFCVVSTGTWIVIMSIDDADVELDAKRDTLMNVNALGCPTPSAKFMGGREFERLMEGRPIGFTEEDVEYVLNARPMLMPSVENHVGPYQGCEHRWTGGVNELSDGAYFVAVTFYLALVSAVCIKLTGCRGHAIVEGPFAENTLYKQMLSVATGQHVASASGTGTSLGAALLTSASAAKCLNEVELKSFKSSEYAAYASEWMARVEQTQ
ncbi:MAG: FGGY-family carbohydrate kinase [Hyphomicrobiales bacterium]